MCGAFAALAVLLVVGFRGNISGAYLAADSSSVIWLQVVRTPDSHLTGQLAENVLKPDGTIEQSSASLTGAVDGENVTIQGSRFFGLDSFVFSGTLHGNVLTLTGAQSVPLTFTRSTPAEFQGDGGCVERSVPRHHPSEGSCPNSAENVSGSGRFCFAD